MSDTLVSIARLPFPFPSSRLCPVSATSPFLLYLPGWKVLSKQLLSGLKEQDGGGVGAEGGAHETS